MTVEYVTSRATFATFVESLRADLLASASAQRGLPSFPHGVSAGGWENPTLERFLGALASYANDAEDQISEPPRWQTFAQLLAAAKIYE